MNRGIVISGIKRWLLRRLSGIDVKRAFNRERVRQILVLRYDRIGDMVVTTPLIRALSNGFQNSTINVLCSRVNEPILRGNRFVQKTIIYRPSALQMFRLILCYRSYFDLIVDLNHSVIWHDLVLIRLLRPLYAASVHKEGRYGIRGRDLPLYQVMGVKPVNNPPRPIARFYLELAAKLTGHEDFSGLTYDLTESTKVRRHLREAYQLSPNHKLVLINAHGGRPSMSIGYEDFLAVTGQVLESQPDVVVCWLSTSETQPALSELLERIRRDKRRQLDLSTGRLFLWQPTDTIEELISFVADASLLITPDTSLVHIAAAFKVPTVAIYANEPELFAQWAPESPVFFSMFSANSKSLLGYDPRELRETVNQALRTISTSNAH